MEVNENNKRYEVFVSSTYADLKKERAIVMKAILDMGHFPTGMEVFPATDQQQFEYIKKVMDTADYYILILGGCSGSMYDKDKGISYTRMEYEYAIEKGIPIIAFVKSDDAGEPIIEKNDLSNPNVYNDFLNTVQKNRLRKAFKTAEELSGLVLLSLTEEIKVHPRYGWVRAYKPEVINDGLLLRGRLFYHACIDSHIYQMENTLDDIKLDNINLSMCYGQGSQGAFVLSCSRDGNSGHNFYYDIDYAEIDCFDEDGYLKEEYRIQLSLAKMGNVDEILLFISVGDGCLDMITKVFCIDAHDFKHIGTVCGQSYMYLDYTLTAPYGGQGLYDSYVYCDGEIMRVEPLDVVHSVE